MKFLKYMALAAAALLSASCQEDDLTVALPAADVAAPVMAAHGDVVVDEATLQNEVTFSWSAADYGYQASVTYRLYVAYGDETNVVELGTTHSTTYTLTKELLNNTLVNTKGLAVPEGETSTIFLYVVSSISTGGDPAYNKQSEMISFQVTTIKSTSAPWIRRPLYVAGNFQGWDPATAPVLWENGENSDVYEGLVYLGAAAGTPNFMDDGLCHFKFCPNPNWQGNLGGDLKAMTTEGNPDNLKAEAGLYWITVTLDAAHTTGSVDLREVSQIGVIGTAAGGWDDGQDWVMTLAGLPTDTDAADYADRYYAAMCGQTWEATGVSAGGEFKFRLDGAWTSNWGGDNLDHLNFNGGNCSTLLTGKVRFTICFRGDIPALAEDTTNPSPVSATVEAVE